MSLDLGSFPNIKSTEYEIHSCKDLLYFILARILAFHVLFGAPYCRRIETGNGLQKNNTVIKVIDGNICGKKERNHNCFGFERENDSCHQIKGFFFFRGF